MKKEAPNNGIQQRRPVLATMCRLIQEAHPEWTRERCLIEAKAQWTRERTVPAKVRRFTRLRISG